MWPLSPKVASLLAVLQEIGDGGTSAHAFAGSGVSVFGLSSGVMFGRRVESVKMPGLVSGNRRPVRFRHGVLADVHVCRKCCRPFLARGRTDGCATFAIPLTDEPSVRRWLSRAWLSIASRLATDPPWLGPVSPSGWGSSVLVEGSWS